MPVVNIDLRASTSLVLEVVTPPTITDIRNALGAIAPGIVASVDSLTLVKVNNTYELQLVFTPTLTNIMT